MRSVFLPLVKNSKFVFTPAPAVENTPDVAKIALRIHPHPFHSGHDVGNDALFW